MRYNVPKSCAARLCRACEDFPVCVAVMYLTLRTGYEKHGSKNPLPYPISERSHIGNLRQIRNQGKGRSSKKKGNRRCPFLFALAAGAATFPPPAGGASLAEVQRKLSAPSGRTCLRSSCAPAFRCRKKLPPVKGEPPAQFVRPGQSVQKKGAARQGRTA